MKKILNILVLVVALLSFVKVSNCTSARSNNDDYDDLYDGVKEEEKEEDDDDDYKDFATMVERMQPPRPTSQGCDLGQECVVYYNCADISTDASWEIDERMDSLDGESVAQIKPCPSLEKCCQKKKENPFPYHTTATTTYTRPTRTTIPTRTATSKATKPSRSTSTATTTTTPPRTTTSTTITTSSTRRTTSRRVRPTRPLPVKNYVLEEKYCRKPSTTLKCGHRNVQGLGGLAKSMQGKINYSQYGEFPWTVALVHKSKMNLQGGGSLIHPKVVLTAYHVLYGRFKNVMVIAGEWDTKSTKEICPTQNRKIERVLRHDDYDPVARVNNVALLLLKEEFNLTSAVNTVCLPPAFEPEYTRSDCWSGGWGKNKFGAQGVYQEYLKKIKMPLYDHDYCEKKLNSTGLMKAGWSLHEKLMCAGK